MQNGSKVAVVTGGLSGIGAAVAKKLASDGMVVVIGDITARSSDLTGQNAVESCHVDVTDAASVQSFFSAVRRARPAVDCLVHCAGIGRVAPFLETSFEMFDSVLKTNLYGTFLVGQAFARLMKEAGGGAIVNIGSVSGLRGNVGRAAYGPSKAALHNLTKVMAVELAEHGVRVNAIAPGPIETPLATTQHAGVVRDAWTRAVPMHRYGQPEDVADMAAFLCSDNASYVTGGIFALDGGFTAAGVTS